MNKQSQCIKTDAQHCMLVSFHAMNVRHLSRGWYSSLGDGYFVRINSQWMGSHACIYMTPDCVACHDCVLIMIIIIIVMIV